MIARPSTASMPTWTPLLAGHPVSDNAVDPEWRAIDRQFRALDRAPTPPPAFAARLLEDLMLRTRSPLHEDLGRTRTPTVGLPAGSDAPQTLPPSARRWVPTHLVTAALLLLIVVG